MNITRKQGLAARALLLSAGLALAAPTLVEAQRTLGGFPRSDQSDVTGPAVTSGDQLATLFAEPGTVRSMFCPVAWGVRTATDQARARLAASTQTANRGSSITRVTAQEDVLALLTAAEDDDEAGLPVLAALTETNSRDADRAARRLVNEASGLFTVLETLDPARPGELAATRLDRTVGAYNAFIDASGPEFLANAPEQLMVLHGVLNDLVVASLENADRAANVDLVDDSGLACAVIATAPPVIAAPVIPADQPFSMCVLVNGDFRNVAALRTGTSGDSVVILENERVALSEVYPAANLAPTAPWVDRSEAVTIGDAQYQPFGVTRIVQPGEIFRLGEHEGFEYFTSPEDTGAPVIYFVAGPECLVQPYRSVETIRVRG